VIRHREAGLLQRLVGLLEPAGIIVFQAHIKKRGLVCLTPKKSAVTRGTAHYRCVSSPNNLLTSPAGTTHAYDDAG
jgi:hypothetical protein